MTPPLIENLYVGPKWRFPIEEGKVREFARAVHDPGAEMDPLPVPPTFPTYGAFAFAPERVVQALDLDITRVLHVGEEYEYHGVLEVGDELTCRTRVIDDYVKRGRRGGEMRFIEAETEMRDTNSENLVVEIRSTYVVLGSADERP